MASETRPATNIAVGTADRKTTYAYDAFHRLTLETRPAPGGLSAHAAPTTAFTYDDAGNKASVTDPEKRLTTYANRWTDGTLLVKHFLTHAEYDKNKWCKDCAPQKGTRKKGQA